MRRLLLALCALFALPALSVLPTLAADNSVLLTPCASGCVTMRTKDVGSGVESPLNIPGDTSGNALATAPGSGNTSFALPIQGVASGVAVPVSASALPLPTSASTSANQSSQLTQETATAAALGTTADSVCGTATGTCSLVALQKYNNSALNSAIPAGTNVIGKVGVDQTTFGTTNGVVSAANTYNTVAASQTAQALTGGGGGATGDYLSHCVITPGAAAAGVVTILDNATSIVAFAGGGTTPLSNLVPFTVPLGAKSTSGAWKITTGANVTVVCVGKFT